MSNRASLFLLMFILSGCATTPQPQAVSQSEPTLLERAEDIIASPIRMVASSEVDKAATAAKDKIDAVDVQKFNVVLDELYLWLHALHNKATEMDAAVLNRTANAWQQPAASMNRAFDKIEHKLSVLEPHKVNATLDASTEAAAQLKEAAGQLERVLTRLDTLLASIEPTELTHTVEQIQSSTRHVQQAAAQLPSTSASLSHTIWLLNILLAAAITLCIVVLIGMRRKAKHT